MHTETHPVLRQLYGTGAVVTMRRRAPILLKTGEDVLRMFFLRVSEVSGVFAVVRRLTIFSGRLSHGPTCAVHIEVSM